MIPGPSHPEKIGPYDVLRVIGQGGMGRVYLGRDPQTGQQVAIKQIIQQVLHADPDMTERVKRESAALRVLNHPNIVKILDVIEDPNNYTIVLEYIEGGSLWDLLHQEGALPIERMLRISLELVDALTRAHHLKIIHRDIKPANVLLTPEGVPKLTDFGIVRLDQEDGLTKTGTIMGSASYLSPEAALSMKPDAKQDIWAFGVIMYEMLAGKRPFVAENISGILMKILMESPEPLDSIRSDIPPRLVELIHKMLDKNPENRIPSIRRVGAEIESILDLLDGSQSEELPEEFRQFLASRQSLADLTPSQTSPQDLSPVPASPNIPTASTAPTVILPDATLTPKKPRPLSRRLMAPISLIAIVAAVVVGALLLRDKDSDDQAAQTILITPVATGDVMVLVANLEALETARPNVDQFILDDLRQSLESGAPFTRLRIREYPATIRNEDEALAIAVANNAPIIVWGNYNNSFLQFEIKLNPAQSAGLDSKYVESVSRVSLRIQDERKESIAAQILTASSISWNFRGDVYESVACMVYLDEFDFPMPEIVGSGVAPNVYRFYAEFFTNPSLDALKYLEAALAIDASNPMLYHLRSMAYQRLGMLDEALEDSETAIRFNGDLWASHMIIGTVKLSQNQNQEAIDSISNMIAITNNWFAYTIRASLYYIDGDWNAAQADIEQALANNPHSNLPYMFASIFALREGRIVEAQELLRTVLRQYPDPTFMNRIISTFAASERSDQAVMLGSLSAAFSNMVLGQYREAFPYLNTAISINPNLAELYLMRGVAHCVMGDYHKARLDYTTGLEVDPSVTLLYLLRGDVHRRLGQFPKAVEDFAAAQASPTYENFLPFIQDQDTVALGCEYIFALN